MNAQKLHLLAVAPAVAASFAMASTPAPGQAGQP